jgi:hypothetical protein
VLFFEERPCSNVDNGTGASKLDAQRNYKQSFDFVFVISKHEDKNMQNYNCAHSFFFGGGGVVKLGLLR